jgi:hypothetical protein
MGPNVVIASACEAIQGPQQPQPNDLLDRRVAIVRRKDGRHSTPSWLLAMTRPPRRDVL